MINTLNNVLFILIWTSLFILINGAVTIITVTTLYYLDEFARAYVVRAEMSLTYAVLQVNKFLVTPYSWLPGLAPLCTYEAGYPLPLEKRLEQCYLSRASLSARDYSEGLRPISLSWALALLGACDERVQSLMIRESYARRTHLRKGSSSVGAYERLGRKMQLMVNQVSLPVLRCLTSTKMRFVHVLSVSKLVGWYWYNKGLASQRSGEYHLAIKYYQKALMYNPGSVDIWYNLGYSYLENKQYVTAIECFRTVARLDVDHEYDVLFCIARCAA